MPITIDGELYGPLDGSRYDRVQKRFVQTTFGKTPAGFDGELYGINKFISDRSQRLHSSDIVRGGTSRVNR